VGLVTEDLPPGPAAGPGAAIRAPAGPSLCSRTQHEPPPVRPRPSLKRLLGFVRRFLRHRWELLAGIASIPLVALCDIRLTLWFGDALSRLSAKEDPGFLKRLFVLILGVAALQGLFRFLARWWIVGVSRKVEVELKQELFDKLARLPLSFHVKSRSGDIVSRLTSDVENVRMLIGPGSMYVLGSLFMVPACGSWRTSPRP
jgi:ATP-binding cassette, subfamily B, multidrug efflux pump